METLCIDLVDTKTDDENHQGEESKRGILCDGTVVQNYVPKLMKSENDKNEYFDVEVDVVKSELKIERGNESESETVVCKRIDAEYEFFDLSKIAKRAEIKSKNEEQQCLNVGNQIGLSAKKSIRASDSNGAHFSDLQKKSFKKNESVQISGKIFQCDICLKAFNQNGKLEIHHRTHTGEKPFECKTCQKAFAELGNLKKHERIHSGERPFECKTCMKTFSKVSRLKEHEKIHTGEKPFECKTCKKSFSNLGTLRQHEKIHTGEKPFECKTCRKTFLYSHDFKRHQRTHSGEKPFECQTCKK